MESKAITNHDQYDQVRVLASDKIGIIIMCETITIINKNTGWERKQVQECIVKFTDQSTKTYIGHELRYNDDEIEMQCETCDGSGIVEKMQECGKVASMCCGGCYVNVECNDCSGTGSNDVPIYEIIKF